ncbi:tol-pal system protein YbgF [Trichlorobacter ammonificans]|uniref:Cell division coordinator CpoB n=1 Tax=Trichlorobacter ammonificans TaxID=2916410 RepID=A0ABM9DDD3_9BACT|nr:tol-pal system protein YbgF [Trichlorobacter ammonificans]CAH2032458.1 Cell division coordinator CpoB [Trichlorobacter ammonificans]
MRCPTMLGLLLAGGVLLGGCGANDLVVKRQSETEARVEHLFQVLGGVEGRLGELAGRLASLEQREAARDAELRALREAGPSQQPRIQADGAAVVPRVELVNPEPAVKPRDGGPPPAYLKAFGLYSANSFAAAIPAFEQFIQESPASEFVPNAWYWIGECHYSSSDIPKALVAFRKVVDGWPRHPKAADALLKIGYSHVAAKRFEDARSAFEHVIRSYPGSPAASKARERMMAADFPAK